MLKFKILVVIFVWSVMPMLAQTVVQMNKNQGVWTVPCKIDEAISTDFIYDPGSSDVSISSAEANILKKYKKLDPSKIFYRKYTNAFGDTAMCEEIILDKIEFAGFVLKNVKASVVDNPKAPLLLGLTALSCLGEIKTDYSKGTLIFINTTSNINISFFQECTYSIFSNKISKALKAITEKNDCNTAMNLLDKANDRQKNKMKVTCGIINAICLENNCDVNAICNTNCEYYKLRDLYKELKNDYLKISNRDFYYLQKNNYKGETLDNKWVLLKYMKYEKYFAERALELLKTQNKFECKNIISLLICADNFKDSTYIKTTRLLDEVLKNELCNTNQQNICTDLYRIKSAISKGDISKEDIKIFKDNNINFDSLVSNKIDSTCTRKTVLALRLVIKSKKQGKHESSKIKYYLDEARSLNIDSVEIPLSYYSAFATYFLAYEKDTVSYCYYHDLALACKNINVEDSLIYKKFKNYISTFSCHKYLVLKADIYVKKLNDFVAGAKKTTGLVNEITINNEPLVSRIEKLTTEESIILTEVPIWASDNYNVCIYKNRIIDTAIYNYFQTILEFIESYKTPETAAYINILGTADGNPNKGISYNPIVDNKNEINYTAYQINDLHTINSYTFSKNNSTKITGSIDEINKFYDIDLAYLRAFNIQSIFKNCDSYLNIKENNIYVYDYPDTVEYELAEFRLVKIKFIINNLLFNNKDLEKNEKLIKAIEVHNKNNSNLLINDILKKSY